MGARLLDWLPSGGPRLAVALLATVIAGGTVGYVAIEGWSAWDAFYMTVTTITTVGYREVHELDRAGQVFTVFLLIGGVGTALYTFTLLATTVVEGGLPIQFRQRRHARMLESIKDHFIVCGFGRIGSIIAGELSRRSVPIVIIEREAARVKESLERGFLTLEADASDETVLARAGIARARGLIAAVGTDAENVYAVLSARVMRPDLFIIGRAEGEGSLRKLRQAGANRVISPYQIGAQHIAQSAISPAVVDFIQLATSAENLELAMEEVTVSQNSPLANRSILASNLRQRFGVIVVAIQRQNRKMDFNPEPESSILPGDTLVVLGRSESLKRLEVEAGA
jgi:voltage-gated potassium channel